VQLFVGSVGRVGGGQVQLGTGQLAVGTQYLPKIEPDEAVHCALVTQVIVAVFW